MKKLLTLILSLVMTLSLCVPTAFAAKGDMDHFQKVNTYDNQFSDISGWAVSVIETCYEYGLMNGKGEGTFVPKGNLTVAEALVMACRVHEIYNTGVSTLTNGSPWYQSYVDYALANGIIAEGDFTAYNVNVTRAQMAYIFAGALPESELAVIKTISSLPDVSEDMPYYEDIVSLYAAGVLTGSDAQGTFLPNNSITRQEAAAIIARVAIPSMRSSVLLLENVACTDTLSICMPQGFTSLTQDDGTIVYDSEQYAAMVKLTGGYDGLDLHKLFAGDALGEMLISSFSDQIRADSLTTVPVTLGGENGYRTSFLIDIEGDLYRFVITTIIHDGDLCLVQCFALEGAPQLSAIVNGIRFSGKAISPAM